MSAKFTTVTKADLEGVVDDLKTYQRVYEMTEVESDGSVIALNLDADGPKAVLDFRWQNAVLVTKTTPNTSDEPWEGYMMIRDEMEDGGIHYLICFSNALQKAYNKF